MIIIFDDLKLGKCPLYDKFMWTFTFFFYGLLKCLKIELLIYRFHVSDILQNSSVICGN